MAIVETESLVLRSYNLSDADKIVVFLTLKEGLVRGVAKGAKRLKSKFGGSLEPFSIVNLTYLQKDERELVNINQIELQKSFFKNASQIDFLEKFGYLAELLIEFAPPHDPNERLYKMSKICLETASENPSGLDSIALYFEIWILRLGGFLPVWENCNLCKRPLSDDEQTNLHIDFHLVCIKCQNRGQNRLITTTERSLFAIAQKVSPKKFVYLTEGKNVELTDVSNILKRIISQVLGKELIRKKILTAKF